MSKDHGPPSGAFVNFLAAIVKATPRDLSDEAMQEWSTRQSDELARRLSRVLKASPHVPMESLNILDHVDSLPARHSHKDIRIQFKAGRHWYVAVGFLGPKEIKLDCETILQRTANIGREVYAENCAEICECYYIPKELWGFDLLTQWTIPGPPSTVCFLSTDAINRRQMKQGWMNLDSQCRSNTLVLLSARFH